MSLLALCGRRSREYFISRVFVFLVCAGAAFLPGVRADAAESGTQPLACTIDYSIRDDWGTGATIDVTITNFGTAPISGWTLAWSFPGNQQITHSWCGTFSQNGQSVSAVNLDYNSVIGAGGGKVALGFNVSYSGTNTKPGGFTLNGEPVPGSVTTRAALPGSDYSIGYAVREAYANQATIDVTITNLTIAAVNGWTLTWTFPGNQTITSMTNGTFTQNGTSVSLKNTAANGTITAGGGRAQFSFVITYSGANKKPTNIAFNGSSCLNTAMTLKHQGIAIAIPAGAATAGSVIEVTSIEQDQIRNPSSDIPIVSSTAGSAPGFEVTLDDDPANTFRREVSITLKYDPLKLPESVEAGSVFIYYYHEASGSWLPFKRSALNTQSNSVTCTTDHFCQMLAGSMVIATESPQGKGINTMPRNIEDAAPMAGIRYIDAPAQNNQGTAVLRYPFPVPAGVNGATPELAIAYSSEMREGNCGFGWQFSTSAITLDTSKGLPKYDSTDTILWDGRELVPVGNDTYRCKVEGSFAKIVRVGSGFLVHLGNGARMYYGWHENARLSDAFTTGRTFAWYLTMSADKFNNTITYEYRPRSAATATSLNDNVYLEHVRYGYQNAYSVDFSWSLTDNGRSSASRGFLVEDQRILSGVKVSYKNSISLKSFVFYYGPGAFGKNILSSIEEKSGDGNVLINKASFVYDTNTAEVFSGTNVWSTTPLGIGFGEEDLRYTFTNNDGKSGHTEIDLVDYNGDGLPDRVAKHRDDPNFYVQFNTGYGFTNTYVFRASSGFQAYGDADLRYVFSSDGKSHTEIDFADFTGDGRPDFIAKHRNENQIHVQVNTPNVGTGFNVILNQPLADLTPNSEEDLRYSFTDGDKTHTEIDFIDMNRDGRPDRVAKHRNTGFFYVQYATEYGFTQTVAMPVTTVSTTPGYEDIRYVFRNNDGKTSHTEIDFVDVNGDGLPDRVAKHRDNAYMYVQYNTGTGFSFTSTRPVPNITTYGADDVRYSFTDGDKSHTELDFIDINGDGLPDRVAKHRDESFFRIQYANGAHFMPVVYVPVSKLKSDIANEDLRYTFSNDDGKRSHTEIDFVDMNGDGLPDRVAKHRSDPNVYIQFNMLRSKNRLVKVVNTTGAEINLTYDRIKIDENAAATHNFQQKDILKSVTTGHPEILTVRSDYSYWKGVYDRIEKEFRGFTETAVYVNDQERPGTVGYTLTTYRIEDTTGAFGNYGSDPVYDQYYRGQIDRAEQYRYINNVLYTLSKERCVYNKYDVLSSHPEIKYPALIQKRAWLYNPDPVNNRFMGVDATNGDLTLLVQTTIDTTCGLVAKTRHITYNDPNHNWDDIVAETDNAIDASKWYCLKSMVEMRQSNNAQTMSLKTLAYNANASLASETVTGENGTAAVTTFTYDSYGHVVKVVGADGLTTTTATQYPANADVYMETTAARPEKGITETKRFDIYGRPYETVNAQNELSRFTYDRWGRLIYVYETIGGVLTPTRRFAYGTTWATGPIYYFVQADYLNNAGTNDYVSIVTLKDRMGREAQVKTEGVVGGVKCWIVSGHTEYDRMGRTTKTGTAYTSPFIEGDRSIIPFQMKDPVTRYEYDALGRLSRTIATTGLVVETTRDTITDNTMPYQRILFKTVTCARDGNGVLLQEARTYRDVLSQTVKTERVRSDGSIASASTLYNLHGFSATQGGTAGKVERQKDRLGRLVWQRTTDAGTITYAYNNRGLLATMTEEGKNETDSVRRITKYTYDSQTNDLTAIDRDGSSEDVYITYYGNSEANLFARSNVRRITVTNGFVAEFNYGPLWSEELRTIDGKTYKTRYEYDVQGRIKNLVYPDGETVKYRYNDGGFLAEIAGNYSYLREVIYDALGRRTSIRYGNDATTIYTYDDANQALKNMTVRARGGLELVNSTYAFDITGHLSSVTDAPGGSTRSVQNYSIDDFSDTISSSNGTYYSGSDTKRYATTFGYDADGRIAKKTQDDSLFEYIYIPGTHKLERIDVTAAGTKKGTVEFAYDDFGNMTQKTNGALLERPETAPAAACAVTYTVRTEWNAGATVDMTITNNGPTPINGWTVSWNFPASQQIYEIWSGTHTQTGSTVTVKNVDYNAVIAANGGTVTFGFNLSWSGSNPKPASFTVNGSSTGGGGSHVYAYGPSDNLLSIDGSSIRLTFAYDHAGQRIKKSYRDPVALIKETIFVSGLYTVSGGKESKHIHDGISIIASKLNSSISTIRFYHSNHIGSTILTTDANGAKSQAYLYLPFGHAWITENRTGGVDVTRLFTGQEFDQESGLYYYNARYYDPAIGVFMSPDPALDGFNVYAYVKNNPVIYTDPSGLFSIGLGIVIGWTPEHGFSVGVGVALDFSKEIGIGVNVSYSINADKSTTAAIGIQVNIEIGIVGIGVGVGYSYNTYSGSELMASIGANIYQVGIEVATQHQWTTGGDYVGGRVSFKGYVGNRVANTGGGYEIGWGAYKSGWFTESKIMGFTIRNGKLTGFSSTIGGKYESGKSGVQQDISAISDFNGLVEATLAPVTWGGALVGLTLVAWSQIKTGEGSVDFRKDGMEFVTNLDLGGAISLGFSRLYGKDMGPDENMASYYDNSKYINIGMHERYHTTAQWQKYGVFFLVPYFWNGGAVSSNPMEQAADDAAGI